MDSVFHPFPSHPGHLKAFSVLSPRTVRATGALRGATSASASPSAAVGGVVCAAGVAALCGVAALRRTSRVACHLDADSYLDGG